MNQELYDSQTLLSVKPQLLYNTEKDYDHTHIHTHTHTHKYTQVHDAEMTSGLL